MDNHIYMLRKKKAVKQYDMAKALNVSPSYLSKIETGAQDPTEKFKIACAKYLKTTIAKLFNESSVEESYPEFAVGLKNKLWAVRREMGIKQFDFAKKLKVSAPFLSKVELGLLDPPEDFKNVAARALKMNKQDLFFGD